MNSIYEYAIDSVIGWKYKNEYTSTALEVLQLGRRLDDDYIRISNAGQEEIEKEIKAIKDDLWHRGGGYLYAERILFRAQAQRLNELLKVQKEKV